VLNLGEMYKGRFGAHSPRPLKTFFEGGKIGPHGGLYSNIDKVNSCVGWWGLCVPVGVCVGRHAPSRSHLRAHLDARDTRFAGVAGSRDRLDGPGATEGARGAVRGFRLGFEPGPKLKLKATR